MRERRLINKPKLIDVLKKGLLNKDNKRRKPQQRKDLEKMLKNKHHHLQDKNHLQDKKHLQDKHHHNLKQDTMKTLVVEDIQEVVVKNQKRFWHLFDLHP
jgi:hypothetical protein